MIVMVVRRATVRGHRIPRTFLLFNFLEFYMTFSLQIVYVFYYTYYVFGLYFLMDIFWYASKIVLIKGISIILYSLVNEVHAKVLI